jgi:hypothetical protein
MKEYKTVLDTFKVKRSEIQDLQFAVQELEGKLKVETTKESDRLQKLHILQTKCDAIQREIEEQMTKKSRALYFVNKSAKKLRNSVGSDKTTDTEKDFLVRSLKEVAVFSLKDLSKLGDKYTNIKPKIAAEMELTGLQVPSRSVSRVSSRASSFETESGRSSRAESVTNESISVQESAGGSIMENERSISAEEVKESPVRIMKTKVLNGKVKFM